MPEMIKKRVLWVEPNISSDIVGGSMVGMLETARYLCNIVDLHILYYRRNVLQAFFKSLGLSYHFFFSRNNAPMPMPSLYRRPWQWSYVWAIAKKLRPSIVHINTTPIHALPWVFAKFLLGFRLVVHLRMDLRIYHWLNQFVFDNAEAVICMSQFIHQDLRNLGYRTPRTEVIYDGVRADVLRDATLSGSQAQSNLGLDNRYRWLVLVGNLTNWKGQNRALDAMRTWLSFSPQCRLAIVGKTINEQYFEELQKKAHFWGIGDKVLFVPAGTDRPGLWYRAAFLALHTSDIEPFGLTVAEAIACKCPVVTCAKGGAAEILNRLDVGLVSNPESFERDVLRLLTNEEYYQRIRTNIDNIEYPWTYQNTATSIFNTYCRLCENV